VTEPEPEVVTSDNGRVRSPGTPGRERPVSRVTATWVHRARRRCLRVAAAVATGAAN